MAAYPENTGGIISAIQACIVAAGGTLTQEYPKNTGGINNLNLEIAYRLNKYVARFSLSNKDETI